MYIVLFDIINTLRITCSTVFGGLPRNVKLIGSALYDLPFFLAIIVIDKEIASATAKILIVAFLINKDILNNLSWYLVIFKLLLI